MYGLPADFDPGVFLGKELVQVSFTQNTVHLVFDAELALTLESSFVVRVSPDAESVKQVVPVTTSPLMALAGKRITAARHDGSTLTLEFESGGVLACLDDSKEYESYHIQIGSREIVV